MNALWRRLTGTRVMRSAAAEFGPPPGALYDLDCYSDAAVLRQGHEQIARMQQPWEVAHYRMAAARARSECLSVPVKLCITRGLVEVPR